MNVLLNTMKIHSSNSKKCSNSVILAPLENTILEYGLNKITEFEFDYTKFFQQIGKFPNNNKVTAIWKLGRLKRHPVYYNFNS